MRMIDADEAIINFGFEWDDIPPTREEFVYFSRNSQPLTPSLLSDAGIAFSSMWGMGAHCVKADISRTDDHCRMKTISVPTENERTVLTDV